MHLIVMQKAFFESYATSFFLFSFTACVTGYFSPSPTYFMKLKIKANRDKDFLPEGSKYHILVI